VRESATTYGVRKMHTVNGSHSYRDTISFQKIVGYQNVEELHRRISPYIFHWGETDFKFTVALRYFSLSAEESEAYRQAIRGMGLDKTYCVDLETALGKRKHAYREKSDVFIGVNGAEVEVRTLMVGQQIQYDGGLATVRGVFDKKTDAGYSVRVVKAQQVNSKALGKLKLIAECIRRDGEKGCLVYFNFLDSLYATREYLLGEFPGRRIAVLTGESKDFDSTVASLREGDIVLMSSVASQSLDFYFDHLIVAESFGLTAGRCEQLFGRLTRVDSKYRDISVDFILRDHSVESYFYERLRYMGKHSKTNVYSKDLPVSAELANIPPHLVDLEYLKKTLLWRKEL